MQCTKFQNPIYKSKSYTLKKYSQTHAKFSRNTLVIRNVSGSPKDKKCHNPWSYPKHHRFALSHLTKPQKYGTIHEYACHPCATC